MRRPSIQPWLAEDQLKAWVQNADSRQVYQRRVAIWMTQIDSLPAHRVARFLVISKEAVWAWISQYNRLGPAGLERRGRGGRRNAVLTPTQEAALLDSLQKRAQLGDPASAAQVQKKISIATGREVSRSYVYRLYDRIGWRIPH